MNIFQIIFNSTVLIFLYCRLLNIAVLCDDVLQLYRVFPEKFFNELGSRPLFSELCFPGTTQTTLLHQEQTSACMYPGTPRYHGSHHFPTLGKQHVLCITVPSYTEDRTST